MADFYILKSATRHKVCSYCGGSLVVNKVPQHRGLVLQCRNPDCKMTFTDPKDCAPKRGIETLETEARLAMTDQRVKHRDVKEDIDTFRSLGYMK